MAVRTTTPEELARLRAEAPRRGRSPLADAFHQLLKNRLAVASGIFLIILVIIAVFADTSVISFFTGEKARPLLAPYGYAEVNFRYHDLGPMTRTEDGKLYILGVDYLGRDILSRTLFGARISLAVAFVAATVSLFIGLVYGLASGYFGGRIDNIMMRFVDFLYGLPLIVFVILMKVYFKAISRRGGTGLA